LTVSDQDVFREFGEEIDEPDPPVLMLENLLAWEVFDLCKDQLIVGGFGTIIGIYDSAIELAMDRLGVSGFLERIATVKKVKAIASVIYMDRNRKDAQEDETETDTDCASID